jgi:hypothetical protein
MTVTGRLRLSDVAPVIKVVRPTQVVCRTHAYHECGEDERRRQDVASNAVRARVGEDGARYLDSPAPFGFEHASIQADQIMRWKRPPESTYGSFLSARLALFARAVNGRPVVGVSGRSELHRSSDASSLRVTSFKI